ncbi:NUDIX domain-containing protein [Deinococcus sonorensis]|uniref:NUDIX domain-containing protein n=2 Tax=Deinococcus sonorensis TaxID=309891 RepID=A0AAU7U8Z0_9DEIO
MGAGVACVDRDGRVLLVRRRDNGSWDVPGGRVKPGECTQDAARRELQEETGLRVGELVLLGVVSGPDARFVYPDGNVVDWVTVLYGAAQVQGEARAADDAAEVGWVAPEAVPGSLSAATQQYLHLIRSRPPPAGPPEG